jgi:hypothetical protein
MPIFEEKSIQVYMVMFREPAVLSQHMPPVMDILKFYFFQEYGFVRMYIFVSST